MPDYDVTIRAEVTKVIRVYDVDDERAATEAAHEMLTTVPGVECEKYTEECLGVTVVDWKDAVRRLCTTPWRLTEYTDAADLEEFLSWYEENQHADILDIFVQNASRIRSVEIDDGGDLYDRQPDGTFVSNTMRTLNPLTAGEMLCFTIYAACASPCCPTTIYFNDGSKNSLNGSDEE